MKKNRKLWILLAALVAVVLVAALCLLLPRLQVEPGVPKSGAIVRQEAAEDGRQLFVLERDMEHMSLQEIMNESDLVVMGFLLEQSPGFQVKSTDGEVSTFTNYFFQVTDTYRGEAPGDVITLREEEDVIYAAQFYDCGWDCGLTENDLLMKNFQTIQTSWYS